MKIVNKKKVISLSLSLVTSLAMMSCKNNVSDSSEETRIVQPITDCKDSDDQAPVFSSSIQLKEDSSVFKAPTISFEKATDDCELSHYEMAIGTTSGAQDVLAFTSIGDTTEFQKDGLDLDYSNVYYISLKAVDTAGNKSSQIVSSSFQVFTPKSLSGLVLWLDASQLQSLEDNEGDDGNSSDFSNDIKKWLDISESTAIHNFEKEGSAFPNYDVVERGIRFNGSQELMATADHADINLSVVGQRTLVMSFKTSDNVSSRQVLFEEGGTVRGLNIYIENNELRCGFWNIRNDGDGLQNYIEVKSGITADTKYTVMYKFDYSHFTDANSADGTVECFVNGVSTGSENTTSRLHPHSGDIGLAGMNDGSYFHDGAGNSSGLYFDGVIYEMLLYNTAHSDENLNKLNTVLQSKW